MVYLKVKHDGKLVDVRELRPTLFVPMTGRALREAAGRKEEGEAVRRGPRELAVAVAVVVAVLAFLSALGARSGPRSRRSCGPPRAAARGLRDRREQGRRPRRLVQPPRRQAGGRRGASSARTSCGSRTRSPAAPRG